MKNPEIIFKILLLAGFFAFFGCNEEKTVLYESDPCAEEDCSGHGACAVIGGDTAVCICDPGYYASGDGLECRAATPGDECKDVECSGHGTCVVVSSDPDYPVCLCDDGYKLVGTTTCVPAGTGVECGPGTIREGNVCVPVDEHDPDDPGPCMLEIDDVLGDVTVNAGLVNNQPSLVWAEDRFIAVYTTPIGSPSSPWGLYAKKIYPSGELGTSVEVDAPEEGLGYNAAQLFSAVAAGRVGVGAGEQFFILDLEGQVLHGPIHYEGVTRNVIAVGGDFALVLQKGWKLIAADGTISDVVFPLGADDVIGDMQWSVDRGAAVLYRHADTGLRLQHFDLDGTPLDEPQWVNSHGNPTTPYALLDTGEHYAILSGIRTDDNMGTIVFRMEHDLSSPGVGAIVNPGGTAMGQMVWTGRFFYYNVGRVFLNRYGRLWTDSLGYPHRADMEMNNLHMTNGMTVMNETTIGILRKDYDDPFDRRLTWNLAACAAQ